MSNKELVLTNPQILFEYRVADARVEQINIELAQPMSKEYEQYLLNRRKEIQAWKCRLKTLYIDQAADTGDIPF